MKKIIIYFGPKIGFQSILPKRTKKITLTELAIKSDAKRREHLFRVEGNEREIIINDKIEKVPCLVAYSDEYAGISENAIQSFIGFISQFDIRDIYLQNPPTYIIQQLEKIKGRIDFQQFQYKTINIESLKTINLEFSSKIIGQEKVKQYLLTALYPLCKSVSTKPIVLMFYGPTGVGKTETAKFLSEVLNQKLFRKQFSMFHNEDFSSYLFGGKHSQNCFSKELLERESNIILLDEFDKPHPVFHSAFYQLFDEGVFEDKNYSVKVEKAIIICTSNYTSEDDIRKKLGEPIFSRFDAVIKFNPLSNEVVQNIIKNEYEKQFVNLDEYEKSIVEKNEVLKKVLSKSLLLKNAREAKRVIIEANSTVIVNEILQSIRPS